MTATQKQRQSPHSDTATDGVRVVARAQYLADQSDPDLGHYVYAYRIEIENGSDQRVQLRSRHWKIVDGQGRSEEVVGEGVVGEQPALAPGESFEYRSLCPLRTEWGTMEGIYNFVDDDGSPFEVVIGRFFLVPSAPSLDEELV